MPATRHLVRVRGALTGQCHGLQEMIVRVNNDAARTCKFAKNNKLTASVLPVHIQMSKKDQQTAFPANKQLSCCVVTDRSSPSISTHGLTRLLTTCHGDAENADFPVAVLAGSQTGYSEPPEMNLVGVDV